MAASRFRPPITYRRTISRQPRSGHGGSSFKGADVDVAFEPEIPPVLRKSRIGIRNMPKKKCAQLRAERKADPNGTGIHSWRRRQW